ncbi:MAG: murein hydrolase activator EnvC family protein [Desulfitobacteriia bacterium]|jgi:murein DD-endopeptidase MepM/ murein hydrolase activator NlpD
MNPFERWDDWEWEKAAQELGRDYRYRYRDERDGREDRRYYYRSEPSGDLLDRFTGSQKRVVLAALLFLTIVFSSKGDDIVSQSVYSFYRTGMDGGSLYTALNSLAKEAMGIPQTEGMPVNAVVEEIFYPPVAGAVKVGFEGKNYFGGISKGIEIESSLGTPILCPAEGVVLEVSENEFQGTTVRINFGDGWEGILGNFGEVAVDQGTPVAMGTKLGTVGIKAGHQKAWLYFELLKNGSAVNPLNYLIQHK